MKELGLAFKGSQKMVAEALVVKQFIFHINLCIINIYKRGI
ncbi:hypothetical protein HanIR_Chr06g0270651 [Helianthus annuus]|nr:hypothetical protein HanIR_Chr06g0270651 [Helianthus annuus]